MCVGLDKELLVAGYVNQMADNESFTINDMMEYMGELWNAGCGPISPNFTRQELWDYLHSCKSLIQECNGHFTIDRSSLNPNGAVKKIFESNEKNAISYELLLRLHASINIPKQLLNAIGYGFMCR